MNNGLKKYKKLLDLGSFEGLRYTDAKKSRYESFGYCLDFLKNRPNANVIELGTCRSFVDGKFEGCNSDDSIYWDAKDFSKWDWGAGCFSLIFGQLTDCKLTTLDLIESHIKRCKVMTDSLGIDCNHIVSDSITFLESTNEKFDLIYLDTGDMWPIDSTCSLQLREAQIIVERDLLKEGGILLIDDVLNGTPREMGDLTNRLGKSETSIPYLLNNGYETVYDGYQYILIKKQ
jgi:hypothetical protein